MEVEHTDNKTQYIPWKNTEVFRASTFTVFPVAQTE